MLALATMASCGSLSANLPYFMRANMNMAPVEEVKGENKLKKIVLT